MKTATIEQEKYCLYCGEDLRKLQDKKRTPSRFCNPIHRSAFHNKVKMFYRKVARIEGDLAEIANYLSDNHTDIFKEKAFHEIKMLNVLTQHYTNIARYTCTHCGQWAFIEPTESEKCAYCGKDGGWKIKYIIDVE